MENPVGKKRQARPSGRVSVWRYSGFAVDHGLVGVGIQQFCYGTGIIHADLDDPAVLVGGLIDGFGSVFQLFVHRDDFTGHRGVEVGGGLDRLDDTKLFTLGQGAAQLGKFNEHYVAKRFLSMIGDADDDGAVAVVEDPFVAVVVAQVGRNRAHGGFLYE